MVCSRAKIASLSQGTDGVKLTTKQRKSQNQRSGKGEEGDHSCGHSVLAASFH